MSKYVVVTGGIVSNIGKGTVSAALGRLLKNRGLKVTMQKFDQYLNVDPSTMSPYQHGEVFVTEDGGETDLDLGHYERFLDENFGKINNITAGRVYSSVINKERLGKYVGATVQVVPDITNEVTNFMLALDAPETDVVIIEIGGTINDYDSGIYYRSIRQLKLDKGEDSVFVMHTEWLPYMPATGETKVQSVQTSVEKLTSFGIVPDAVICRTIKNLNISLETKKRIASRCLLSGPECVIQDKDLETVYELPIILQKEGLDELIVKKFKLNLPKADLTSWQLMVNNYKENYPELKICIVGKYTKVPDAYHSIEAAIEHACIYNKVKAKIELVDAEDIEEYGVDKMLRGAKGIIVPPGWGSKGINGMILAIKYAREYKIPYLGIGVGMQLAVVEFARNMLAFGGANSTEFDPNTDYPVIDIMEEQKKLAMGSKTVRLGAHKCALDPNSNSAKLYGAEVVSERHRHRFEFNTKYSEQFEKEGLKLVGMNPETKLIELVELPSHPFFIACIYEPEYQSRPNKPHPLFLGFINTAKSVR